MLYEHVQNVTIVSDLLCEARQAFACLTLIDNVLILPLSRLYNDFNIVNARCLQSTQPCFLRVILG